MQADAGFRSFFLGGFECSTHRLRQGKRLDLIAATRHDSFCEADYARLREIGISSARDGVRWHLIETSPYRYDFGSLIPMLRAARNTGLQVIWDVFHYGWPDDLDIFSPEFLRRFGVFAREVARFVRNADEPVDSFHTFAVFDLLFSIRQKIRQMLGSNNGRDTGGARNPSDVVSLPTDPRMAMQNVNAFFTKRVIEPVFGI
jgi:hypothetical protein